MDKSVDKCVDRFAVCFCKRLNFCFLSLRNTDFDFINLFSTPFFNCPQLCFRTKPCKVCGQTGRNLYDGVCSSCRSKAKSKETKPYLTEAIADTQKTLLLLVELNNGMSYRAAAKMVGLSTTAAFLRIKKLLPARALDFTEVSENGV